MQDMLKMELKDLIKKKKIEINETIVATGKVLALLEDPEEGLLMRSIKGSTEGEMYEDIVLRPVRSDIASLENDLQKLQAISRVLSIYEDLRGHGDLDSRWLETIIPIVRSLGTTGTTHT